MIKESGKVCNFFIILVGIVDKPAKSYNAPVIDEKEWL